MQLVTIVTELVSGLEYVNSSASPGEEGQFGHILQCMLVMKNGGKAEGNLRNST